jgi:predicted aspartyl protease
MTRTTPFDPKPNLIYVRGKVSGPQGEVPLRLVLDTGASMTLVVPQIIEKIGYGRQDGELVTNVYSPLGKEQGYTLRVARFVTLGFAVARFPVNVMALADRDTCDGLVGLNFLRRFNYQVRSQDGCILLENLAPLAS